MKKRSKRAKKSYDILDQKEIKKEELEEKDDILFRKAANKIVK